MLLQFFFYWHLATIANLLSAYLADCMQLSRQTCSGKSVFSHSCELMPVATTEDTEVILVFLIFFFPWKQIPCE